MKKRRSLINSDTLVLLKQIGIGLMVISIVVLLISGVWHGTRLASFTISTIKTEGGQTIKHSEIKKIAEQSLEGNYLGLIPKKFIWLFPKKDLILKIEETERLHSVSLDRKGTELKISFLEYIPKALWCESSKSKECLFVDDTGYAFGKSPKLSGGSFLRFITTGKEVSVGKIVVEEKSFLFLITLSELLVDQEWYVSYVELDQVGDIFVSLVGGGELKVSLDETPESTVENLLTVLASKEFSHLKPDNFKYIDLRFGNKVFVNEDLEIPESDSVSTIEVVNE